MPRDAGVRQPVAFDRTVLLLSLGIWAEVVELAAAGLPDPARCAESSQVVERLGECHRELLPPMKWPQAVVRAPPGAALIVPLLPVTIEVWRSRYKLKTPN